MKDRRKFELLEYNIDSTEFDLERELGEFNQYLRKAGYEGIKWDKNKNVRSCILNKLNFVLDDVQKTIRDLNTVNEIDQNFSDEDVIDVLKKGIRILSYNK